MVSRELPVAVGPISFAAPRKHNAASLTRLSRSVLNRVFCQLTKGVLVMLTQFLMGGVVSVCNITIHAMVMTAVVSAARASITKSPHPSLLLIFTMIATVSILMAAHVLEVIVWSLAYSIVDAAPAGTNLVYFAFVNYATLGYGDVTPVEGWKLLVP